MIAPDFSLTITSDNTSSIYSIGNGFKALKPGYARVNVKSNDGTINAQIKVYVGGGCTKGDVNGDGKINSFDALLVLRNSVQMNELDTAEKSAADINSDGKINSLDALIILQITTETRSVWDFV